MTNIRYARRSENLADSVYDHADDAIILSVGSAYPPILPDVSEEAVVAAKEQIESSMQYGPLMGVPQLRDAIVDYVKMDGVHCTADNVLVTNGAKHATDLACSTFIDAGEKIIIAAPTYRTTLQSMRYHGADFLPIPLDENGMRTDILENRLKTMKLSNETMPKLLFEVPDFQNPTGVTMSLARREHLLQLANDYSFVIVEDDPYRRIRFAGEDVPPLKSMDVNGVVIAVGTVSKIMSPGLRLGWAIADPEIVRRMAAQKAEGGTSPFSQNIVAQLMLSNKLQEHINLVTQHMQQHRDIMLDALAKEIPDLKVRKPQGGYFLWGQLPENVSADELVKLGFKHGVEMSVGRFCFAEQDPGNFIRLAYSYVGPDGLREGARRLGLAYKELTGN